MYIWSSSRCQSEYVISEFWTQCQGLKTIVHDDKNYYYFFSLLNIIIIFQTFLQNELRCTWIQFGLTSDM